MFENWKKKIILFVSSYLSLAEKTITFLDNSSSFFVRVKTVLFDFWIYLKSIIISIISPFVRFLCEVKQYVLCKVAYIWLFLTKYRLLYIIRIALLLFILYKPTLVDLDSLYWLASTVFYFISNSVFFIYGNIIPFTTWFSKTWGYKFIVIGSLLPALWTAKLLRRRVHRRTKLYLLDEDILFSFFWVQQLFVLTLYYFLFLFLFLFFTVLLPVLYIYVSDFDFIFTTRLFYDYYLSSYSILTIFVSYLISGSYYISFFLTLDYTFFFFYTIFVVSLFKYFLLGLLFMKYIIVYVLNLLLVVVLSFFDVYLNFLLNLFINLFSIVLVLWKWLFYGFSWKGFFNIVDIFKNFLFSDNYLCFILAILWNIAKIVFTSLISLGLGLGKLFLSLICDEVTLNSLNSSFMSIKISVSIYIYEKLIALLNIFIYYENTYFKDVTFFGLLSTWYEYLNHSIQRGVSKNNLINWLLIHLYASILAFWILDFDFRVSVRTPPKTPYTLFKEAKQTFDWIPVDMDLNALQTNHTKLYFALLDISFEHIESLQFIYGDFEHIDEEWDEEDETPDEEEFWTDSEETVKVREIIDTDLETTKLKHHFTRSEVIHLDPVSSFTGYERHFLSEIVGEPELVNIEEELRWAYKPLYSPSFEELHYIDNLYSEWVFDPDEDLTLFEVLLLAPLMLFFVYIWLYHRHFFRKRFDHRKYYRAMVAVRRRIFSGFFVEDFLGIPLGDYGRKMMDAFRHHKSPELRFRRFYRNRIAKQRYKFKLLQLEAYFFEKLRLKLYRKVLKRYLNNYVAGVDFLAPRRHFPQFYTGIKQFKWEMRIFIRFGDWMKFDRYTGIRTYRNRFLIWEDLQVALPELFDEFMIQKRKRRKMRKRLWRTLAALPGHISMARLPKFWDERFFNKDLFYPYNHARMRYNYNYYNYIGWRKNRAQWRRYGFTPVQTPTNVWAYHRGTYWKTYSYLKKRQSKHRLIRSIQF